MGLFFSMLHQSSLGATYGVIIGRPIWFRPTMPLLFIASAMAAGPSLVIVVALITRWLRGTDVVPREVLFTVGRIAAAVLLIVLYMRFWDFQAGNYGYVPMRSEASEALTNGPFALGFWAWEIVFGIIVPAALMLAAPAIKSEGTLFMGGSLAVIGLIANRWHTTLIGFLTPLSTNPEITYPLVPSYTPALSEWLAAIGIVSGVLMVLTLGLRYLPAFGPEEPV
jgi:molybdopterin-containing oxidoreductase family membrane subunit